MEYRVNSVTSDNRYMTTYVTAATPNDAIASFQETSQADEIWYSLELLTLPTQVAS